MQYSTTGIDKPKNSNRNKSQKKKTPKKKKNTQPNNAEQTLIQEQKINLKNLKRIMNGKKITL